MAWTRAYNGGLGAEPSWVQGQLPGQGVRGEAPLKLKDLSLEHPDEKQKLPLPHLIGLHFNFNDADLLAPKS